MNLKISCILAFAPLALAFAPTYALLPQSQQHTWTIQNWHMARESTIGPVPFNNDQVLRLSFDSSLQIQALASAAESMALDFWTDLPPSVELGESSGVDVRVPSDFHAHFVEFAQLHSIKYSVMISDLQSLIDGQNLVDSALASANGQKGYDKEWLKLPLAEDPFFQKYQTYDDILSYLDAVVAAYPDFARLVTIGKTYEGLDIVGVRLTAPSSDKMKKTVKKVVYHGGQHAREWIGVTTNSIFIRQLLTQYGKDAEITRLLTELDFTIVPVMNVDGYIHTHVKDRMWRKNRQPNAICVGTDPNRNWDSAWGGPGASKSPCSEAYHGSAAFSAPETKAMAAYIEGLNKETDGGKVISYIDFHAYSQLWMYPFGSSCSRTPPESSHVHQAGEIAASALKETYGTSFKVGSVCKIIYQASGGSLDWTFEKASVPFSYGVELRDTGRYGFLLPADQIVPSGVETFEAVKAINKYILSL